MLPAPRFRPSRAHSRAHPPYQHIRSQTVPAKATVVVDFAPLTHNSIADCLLGQALSAGILFCLAPGKRTRKHRHPQVRGSVRSATTSLAFEGSAAEFWTFIDLGRGAKLIALRNAARLDDEYGKINYIKLHQPQDEANAVTRLREPVALLGRKAVLVNPGDGFGQFCILTSDAEKRLLTQYRSVSRVLGQANSNGVNVADATDIQSFLESLLEATGDGCTSSPSLAIKDSDVEEFRDVTSTKLPFGIERRFNIYLSPMQAELPLQIRQKQIPELNGLKYGLPTTCDIFRAAPFTGEHHGLGIVPAIGKYQFVAGSKSDGVWVRCDLEDFSLYDHNLEGIPYIKDKSSIVLPVTHLWVDFSYTTATYGLDWFFGRTCLARKEIPLWPMPNFIYQQITSLVRRALKKGRTKFQ